MLPGLTDFYRVWHKRVAVPSFQNSEWVSSWRIVWLVWVLAQENWSLGGKKADWLTRKLWQDPESASGQALGVFRLCVSVPILSKDPAPSSSQLVGQRHFVTFYLECYWLPFCCRAGATQ